MPGTNGTFFISLDSDTSLLDSSSILIGSIVNAAVITGSVHVFASGKEDVPKYLDFPGRENKLVLGFIPVRIPLI